MSISPSSAASSAAPFKQKKFNRNAHNHGRILHPKNSQIQHGNHSGVSESDQEVAGSNPWESVPRPMVQLPEVVNGDSEDSFRHHGRPAQEIVGSVIGRGGKNGLEHSGHLSAALSMDESLDGNFLDMVGPSNVDQSNACTNTLPARNVATKGRKSQMLNANHLLNFRYNQPPVIPQQRKPPPRRQHRIKPYNKDLFLQANFRFLVSDMGDYELISSNPDKMLQWEDVASVKYSSSAPVKCPICLESPPLCSQITTCGHIFCFPCILKHLMMGESDSKGEHWKKCPLCSTMISCKDLHTVSISSVKQYSAGQNIEFTLLTRAKTSVIPFEKKQCSPGALPYSIDGQCNSFSKFTLTSDAELSTNKAAKELSCWMERVESEGGDDLELLPYALEAMDQLEQRKKAWTEHRASVCISNTPPIKQQVMVQPKSRICKTKVDDSDSVTDAETMNVKSADYVAFSDDDLSNEMTEISKSTFGQIAAQKDIVLESKTLDSPVTDEHFSKKLDNENQKSDSRSERLPNFEDKEEESYCFYQSADGQLVILHPLSMKCLLHHYGSYSLLPSNICGKILEMETVTQTEAIRKRYRYLSHFPLTTSFQLCEIDLSNILPATAFDPFTDEIEKREAERHRRHKQETRARERDAAAAASQARSRLPEFTVSTSDDKPPSIADFEALGESNDVSTSWPAFDERRLFSHVTRLGFAAGYDPPALKDSLSRELWRGSSPSASSSIHMEAMGSSRQGICSTPTMSFADIITVTPKPNDQPCDNQISQTRNSGKKGKKPTKVLLSTSGGRRY